MIFSRLVSGLLVSGAIQMSVSPTTSQAQAAYSLRDAEYVSNTKDIDVLRYIVCLESVSAGQTRAINVMDALDKANMICRNNAVTLMVAEDIKESILHCGFRQGDASPDMDCSATEAAEIAVEAMIISTGKWLEAITYDDVSKSIWAAESGQRTVRQIYINAMNVIHTYNVGRLPVDFAVDGSDVFTLVATDRAIKRLDGRGNASTLTVLDAYPEGMSIAKDHLWVLGLPDGSSESSVAIRVDTRTGEQQTSRDLGQWATSIMTTENKVWVSHARDGVLSVIDQSSMRVNTITLPGVELWKLTNDSNFVYGGGRVEGTDDAGLLVKINPVTLQEEARVAIPEMITEVTTDGTFVFGVGRTGTIWVVSATDMKLLHSAKPTMLGASYHPTDVMMFRGYVAIAAGQFYEADGSSIKDRSGNDDENGAILLMKRNDLVRDYLGMFEATQAPRR
jgi:hypothetical protein